MRIPILIVHPYSRYIGGAEYSFRFFVENINKQEFEIHILIPAGGALTADLQKIADKVHLYCHKETFHSNRISQIIEIAFLIKKIKKNYNIRLVHGMTFFISNHVLAAGFLTRIPILIHWRDSHLKKEALWGFYIFRKLNFKIITVSEYVKAFFTKYKFLKNKVTAVHNGVDTNIYKKNDHKKKINSKITIGMFSRLEIEKGHIVVLDALVKIKDKIKNKAVLQIFHTGDDENYFKTYTVEKGLSDIVKFMGVFNNIPEKMSEMDLIIIASLQDAFPRVAMEAMSCSVPLLASNSGGLPEVITDQKNGLLFNAGDPQDLAEKLLKLIEHNNLRNMINKDNRKYVKENFSVQKNAEKIMNVYRELL